MTSAVIASAAKPSSVPRYALLDCFVAALLAMTGDALPDQITIGF